MTRLPSLGILLLSGGSLLAQGESPDLITDRPDVTESSSTVPVGAFQFEAGGSMTRSEGTGEESFNILGGLARIGVLGNLEARVGSVLLRETVEVNGVTETVTGFGSLLLGGKIRVLDEGPETPEAAILAHVHVPIGEDVFRPRTAEPELVASISKSLSEVVSFGTNLGGRWNSTSETPLYVATGSFGFGVSEQVGLFAEYFGFFESGTSPSHNIDGGLTWQPLQGVQLDASAGTWPFESGGEWFMGLGLSFRVPG